MNVLSSRSVGLSLPRPARRGRIARASVRLRTVAVAAEPGATVRFKIKRELNFGDKLTVVGSVDKLGRWDASKGLELAWTEGHVWQGEVAMPGGAEVEYKCVVVRGGGDVEWEGGNNRTLRIDGAALEVEAVLESGSKSHNKDADRDREREERRRREKEERSDRGRDSDRRGDARANVAQPTRIATDVELATTGRWQGRDIEFMRSNQHTSDRRGRWDTNGLQGAMLHIVEGDRNAGSWLQKLESVSRLIGMDRSQDVDALAASAIYLQWISTGTIPCVESGGHQRPNKAALAGKDIFINMERCLGGDFYGQSGVSEEGRLAARRVIPWLPSFSGDFTQSVPLTRIRDIAHRSDIPHELKQEIKHTIQNKLHRNAGPEDLVATEKLLARILADRGRYSQGFVQELITFHDELKDFFNAGSAFDRLDGLKAALDAPTQTQVAALEQARGELEAVDADYRITEEWARNNGSRASTRVREIALKALHSATGVRAALLAGLASGLRNDAPDNAIVARQTWRMAEIGLEQYAFVLLSRVIGTLEEEGGTGAFDPKRGAAAAWSPAITALVLAVRNLGLSGFRQGECMAVEGELGAWSQAGQLGVDPVSTRRLKATVDRAKRLVEAGADALVTTFDGRARRLGHALGVPDSVAHVFGEAEVRASVAFPLSSILTLLARACEAAYGGDGYEVIVPGEASGLLVEADSLDPSVLQAYSGKDVVLLLKRAEGDEEVTAAGRNLRAVVLLQELPHLSHLGVRARQEKVPLVTTTMEGNTQALRALVGKPVTIAAGATGGVRVAAGAAPPKAAPAPAAAAAAPAAAAAAPAAAAKAPAAAAKAPAAAAKAPAAAKAKAPAKAAAAAKPAALKADKSASKAGGASLVVPMAGVKASAAGAKAATCGELAALAARAGTFKAPSGVVLPFGAMDSVVSAAGKTHELSALIAMLEAVDGPDLDAACEQAGNLVRGLAKAIPRDALRAVAAAFPEGAQLAVRSSSNVEDLKGMSGAGLYDSIVGVPAASDTDLAGAVAAVWASLYTRRAVLARRAAGVPQRDAAMAVLVQELIPAELSFVLHTAAPGAQDPAAVLAEVAVGLGETLASGTRGSGWRVEARPGQPESATMLGFANFSSALVRGADGAVRSEPVTYAKQWFSTDVQRRNALAARLASVGKELEKELGGPQDVEGAVVGDEVFVVQSRPQPL